MFCFQSVASERKWDIKGTNYKSSVGLLLVHTRRSQDLRCGDALVGVVSFLKFGVKVKVKVNVDLYSASS